MLVRQLETDIYACVSGGDRCAECRGVAQFLLTGRKGTLVSDPFRRSPTFTSDFFALLTSFTRRLERGEVSSDAPHVQLAEIVATFAEQARADYHAAMVVSNTTFLSTHLVRK